MSATDSQDAMTAPIVPTDSQTEQGGNCCDALTLATCCTPQAKTNDCCPPVENAAANEPSGCGCR